MAFKSLQFAGFYCFCFFLPWLFYFLWFYFQLTSILQTAFDNKMSFFLFCFVTWFQILFPSHTMLNIVLLVFFLVKWCIVQYGSCGLFWKFDITLTCFAIVLIFIFCFVSLPEVCTMFFIFNWGVPKLKKNTIFLTINI